MPSFDNLNDNDISTMFNQLETQLRQRNTLTIVEFDEFRPLFNSQDLKLMNQEDIDDLSERYAARISLFHPVIITDISMDSKILFTLPSMFTRTPTLNTLGPGVDNLINAYNNAMNQASNDPIATTPVKMTTLMTHCVNKVIDQNKGEVIKQVQTFSDTIQDLVNQKLLPGDESKQIDENIKKEVEDFDWEVE